MIFPYINSCFLFFANFIIQQFLYELFFFVKALHLKV